MAFGPFILNYTQGLSAKLFPHIAELVSQQPHFLHISLMHAPNIAVDSQIYVFGLN